MEISPWYWLGAGVLLVMAEAILPGAYVLWAGIAAILTGLVVFVFPLSWQMAGIIFACLTVLAVLVGKRVYARRTPTDHPSLNNRAAQLIGTIHVLDQAITNGVGRMRLNDSTWSVRGPDLPANTRVRILAVDGNYLVIEKAD